MKVEKHIKMSESDCEIIIHCFGTFSSMSGEINKAIDVKYPNVYYNISLLREAKGLRIGTCLITRVEKQFIISMFPALYDYDSNGVSKKNFDEIYFIDTLQYVYDVMENLGWLDKKIAVPLYFGSKQVTYVKSALESFFKGKDLTIYTKI